jgi:hypothetical protein
VVLAADLWFRGDGSVVAGGCGPRSEELAVFCRPVVTAPAVVRRDGTVLADAWLPDLVRLGELERHLGDGVIEAAVDAAIAEGRLRERERRRIMSYPLVIRLMIAMTLMPDVSYCEALRTIAGLLADVLLAREWHVPTGKVVTDWRLPVPAGLMEDLFWHAAGPLIGDEIGRGHPGAAPARRRLSSPGWGPAGPDRRGPRRRSPGRRGRSECGRNGSSSPAAARWRGGEPAP